MKKNKQAFILCIGVVLAIFLLMVIKRDVTSKSASMEKVASSIEAED
ncbi:hypothetical protein [Fulvivirga sediminis]|uniref:Uncharacterized protein n=1 Tax=Fulvivirga sediminis TaxID=2803949 RepID=A0A937FCB6_9BACT|nr:hypothetical protein [Fulvivirga sediminis]MBL3658174.1 hypothetical protein [Fulvivirga sediminis]